MFFYSNEVCYIYTHVWKGIIHISCFGANLYLKDTVGLEKFLEETLQPLVGAEPGTSVKQDNISEIVYPNQYDYLQGILDIELLKNYKP